MSNNFIKGRKGEVASFERVAPDVNPALETEDLKSLWSKFQKQQSRLGVTRKGVNFLLEIVNLWSTSY